MRIEDAGLDLQDVGEGRLRAFDLARQYGFLAHVHEDEEVGIGKGLDRAVQTAVIYSRDADLIKACA